MKKTLKVYYKGVCQNIKYYGDIEIDNVKENLRDIFSIKENPNQMYFQDEDGDIIILNKNIPSDLSVYLYVKPDSIPKNTEQALEINRNDINLTNEIIYEVNSDGYYKIFGDEFISNNKDNIDLLINGEEKDLYDKVYLKKGENKIKLKIKNKVTNLSYMFKNCDTNIINIESLKNLDVSNVTNFSHMFDGCKSLTEINGLLKWKVSKGINFEAMFYNCESLSNINGLQNWDVSNGNNFSYMFYFCRSLSNIDRLENWNVSNADDFICMFKGCNHLSKINGLKNWDVSNVKDFTQMFYCCNSLSDIKPLQNWNISKGNNFAGMFHSINTNDF